MPLLKPADVAASASQLRTLESSRLLSQPPGTRLWTGHSFGQPLSRPPPDRLGRQAAAITAFNGTGVWGRSPQNRRGSGGRSPPEFRGSGGRSPPEFRGSGGRSPPEFRGCGGRSPPRARARVPYGAQGHLMIFKDWIFGSRVNILARGPFWGQKMVPKKVILR